MSYDKAKETAIYDIIMKHMEKLDILASYQHYLIFGEVKLIDKIHTERLQEDLDRCAVHYRDKE